MRCNNNPDLSFSNNLSQPEPQITLITFHPAPRKTPSYSWIIWPLPQTGPSNRCKLQLITKIKLSNCSRPAKFNAPNDSGSPNSPSPQNVHTRRLSVFANSRRDKYFK